VCAFQICCEGTFAKISKARNTSKMDRSKDANDTEISVYDLTGDTDDDETEYEKEIRKPSPSAAGAGAGTGAGQGVALKDEKDKPEDSSKLQRSSSLPAADSSISGAGSSSKRKRQEISRHMKWQPFYLSKVTANRQRQSLCVSITDIVSGQPYFAVFMNYMVDQEWLFSECYEILSAIPVLILHGQKKDYRSMLPNVTIGTVDLGSEVWGTHHSKIILLYYETGIRVVIGTSNLLHGDYDNKAQGYYIQDFPLRSEATSSQSSRSTAVIGRFGQNLQSYLAEVKTKSVLASKVLNEEVIDKLHQYDFSSAEVELIGSVPGRHPVNRCQWGHIRVRDILRGRRGRNRSNQGNFDNLVFQCSSLGSCGKDEKYMQELSASFLPNVSFRYTLRLIWPTVDFVRLSIEGYAAGGSIPCDSKVRVCKIAVIIVII
jgi:hypothetical protein